MDETTSLPAPRVRAMMIRLREQMAQTIRGKDALIEQVLACVLAGAHLLLEDRPGLGKTTLAYCLARCLDSEFRRIQFTADLLPSDILGVSVYDEGRRDFVFKRGPIFANIVLADEINRATPKTQSALLEAMDRGRVSVDGNTYELGSPFLVVATQNPVDYEGTFPLPESQMDRFLMRLQMGYPSFRDELDILESGVMSYDSLAPESLLNAQEVRELQRLTRDVFVERTVREYILRLVTATRTETELRAGASVRGALSLQLAAKATALLAGRPFVLPEDVARVIEPVLAHRLTLRRPLSDPMDERRTVEGILRRLVDAVPQPV